MANVLLSNMPAGDAAYLRQVAAEAGLPLAVVVAALLREAKSRGWTVERPDVIVKELEAGT